jgi:hypothetical protein
MLRRIAFLLTVFVILLTAVIVIGWISKAYIFGKLEPPFIGALVAAAGAIFAACIAYSAAIENVKMARRAADTALKNQAEAERLLQESRRDQALRELGQMHHLQTFFSRLLVSFDGVRDQIGDNDYFSCYENAARQGLLVTFTGGAPGTFSARARDLMQRLIEVRHSIAKAEEDLRTMGAGAASNRERERLSASIRMIVSEAMIFRETATAEIERREQFLDSD